jgi:hypothetical protein
MPDPPSPAEDDDDFELELEAVDPEILAHERARAQQKTDDAIAKVDVDEIYKKPESNDDYDIPWEKLREFKFTTRHLLMLTALLAFGLTLYLSLSGCMALFIAGLLAVGAGWFYITRTERREAKERERRRREFDAANRANPNAVEPGASTWVEERPPRPEFRFAFSIKQVLITMTVAAVVLGLLTSVGPKAVVITLGAISLVGLAVQTFGWFDPPPAVVFGWWMLLALYLILGLVIAIFGLEFVVDRATPENMQDAIIPWRDC